MPIYEYVCIDCKNIFETLRPILQADDPISCTVCESDHTSRKLSLFYAQSGGRSLSTSGCGTCGGGTCSTCSSVN